MKKCVKLKAWRWNNHTMHLIRWLRNMIYFACSLPCQITSRKDVSFKCFVVGCNSISVTMLIFVPVLICCDFELIHTVSHLSTSSLVILELLYVLCMIFIICCWNFCCSGNHVELIYAFYMCPLFIKFCRFCILIPTEFIEIQKNL